MGHILLQLIWTGCVTQVPSFLALPKMAIQVEWYCLEPCMKSSDLRLLSECYLNSTWLYSNPDCEGLANAVQPKTILVEIFPQHPLQRLGRDDKKGLWSFTSPLSYTQRRDEGYCLHRRSCGHRQDHPLWRTSAPFPSCWHHHFSYDMFIPACQKVKITENRERFVISTKKKFLIGLLN